MKDLSFVDVSRVWMGCADAFVTITDKEIPLNVRMFHTIQNLSNINSIIKNTNIKNKVLFFGGGADIHPSIYDHKNLATYCNKDLSQRDKIELDVAKYAIEQDIPMVGVCRGAQLLTALAGGFIIQDVTNHASGGHKIYDSILKKTIHATSAHHQMCYPYDVPKAEVWATALPRLSQHYIMDTTKGDMQFFEEPEVIFYPNIKALCIQGHPEFVTYTDPYSIYSRDCLRRFLERINYA